jgi:hypothetical protein
MKINKYKILILAISFGVFYSCEDKINPLPESFVSPETFYSNNAELQSALVGVYDGLQKAYNNATFTFGEFRSDNVQPSPSTTNISRTSLHNSSFDPAEGFLNWSNFYRTIDRVNRVILGSENFEGADPNIVGQAYAIRSKVYFDLIRIWNNVPLLLEPVRIPSDAFKPVTSFDEIMNDVVIPDMLKAESLLRDAKSNFTFSKSSILAHQAEVYMWQKQESTAESKLEQLIGLNTHSLVTTPEAWQNLFYNQPQTSLFPVSPGKVQSGSELIFSILYEDADLDDASGLWSAYVTGANITSISEELENKWIARFPIDTTWNDLYPTTPPVFTRTTVDANGQTVTEPLYGDWRHFASRERGDFIVGMGPAAVGEARLHKWTKDRTGLIPQNDRSDIVMFRYADMILLLAEAKIKLGKSVDALNLINRVRDARKLPRVTTAVFGVSQNEQIDFLLDERQFELLGEAKRWWDLRRNNKVIEVLNPILEKRGGIAITEQRLFFPIFQNHIIEALGSYTQNPGW